MSGVRRATIQLSADVYNTSRNVRKKSLLDEILKKKRKEVIACANERVETLARNLQSISRNSEQSRINIDLNASEEVQFVNNKINELVTAQNKRIAEQGEWLQERVSALSDEQSRISTTLFENSISQAKLNDEIDTLKKVISKITERDKKKENIANCILLNAESLINEADVLAHERFAPGVLDKIRKRFADSKANYNNSIFEAALVGAQNIITEVLELKEDVVQKQIEHEKWLAISSDKLADLEGRFQQAYSMEYELKTSVGIETVPARIDTFCDGSLSIYNDVLKNVTNLINGKGDSITTDDLMRSVKTLNEIDEHLSNILVFAHENFMKACQREEVLNDVAETLSSVYGMEFEEAAYWGGQGDVANSAIHAKFNNALTGDEIVLVITPQKNDQGVVVGESLDLDITEAGAETRSSIDNRSREIMSVINTHTQGLTIENSICDKNTQGVLSPRKYIGDMGKVNRGIQYE